MNHIETQISIVYRWWGGDEDQPIIEEHINQLDIEARSKINSILEKENTFGKLQLIIDNIIYCGWWDIEIERE